MKIVLPLAGKGTRLLPHSQFVPKPLMFVAGKSILDHLMEELIPLNPSEFVFITGYKKEEIESHLKSVYPDIPMRFIEQINPQGLGHAIYQARDAFSKDEDMLVILGDQTFTIDWKKLLENSYNRLTIVPVDNPSSYGIVSVDDKGFIKDMEEKPETPKSNLAITGTYYFPSAQTVFSAIAHQISKDIRTKGEIQITDSMRIMMELGEQFEVLKIDDWNDCGNHADLLEANKTLLTKNGSSCGSYDSTVTINKPVWIDPSVRLSHCTIGPNVSIAKDVTIEGSTIGNTIIDEGADLKNCQFIDSYLGRGLNLKDQKGTKMYLA